MFLAHKKSTRIIALWTLLLLALAFAYRWIFTGQVLAGRDVYRLFIPDADFLIRCIRNGHFPLWNPYERLGQPFFATIYSQVLYPPHLLLALFGSPVWVVTVQQVFNSAIASTGAFLFTRRINGSIQAALLAAGAFGLGPMMVHLGIQSNVASCAAWTGYILLASHELAQRLSIGSALKLTAFMTLSLFAGSPETLIWQGILAFAVAMGSSRKKKSLALFSLTAVWTVVLSAVLILPASEFVLNANHSASASERFQWSTPVVSLLSMGWFGADLPKPTYSGGEQNFIPTVFIGALVVLLWLASFWFRKNSWSLRLLNLGGLFFALLALGSHFWPSELMLDLPPFRIFRYPAKYLVGAGFCMAMSAGLSLDRLTRSFNEMASQRKKFILVSSIIAVLLGGVFLCISLCHMRQGASSGAIWLGGFVLLAAIALFVVKDKSSTQRLKWVLAGLVLMEIALAHFVVGSSYWMKASELRPSSTYADYLGDDFRKRTSVIIESDCVKKKTCMKMDKRYNILQSLIVMVPRRNTELGVYGVDGYGAPIPKRFENAMEGKLRSVYDMFGAEYFVRRGKAPFGDLQEVIHPEGMPGLWRSDTAMPRAWVVQRAKVVSAEQALAALRDEREPARKTAFLEKGKALDKADCDSVVKIADEDVNHLTLDVDACTDGYLVLSDQYFPGWRAEVNGDQVPLYRANYIMRAVAVKKGKSTVKMSYSPWTFKVGACLSLFGLLALVAAWTRKRLRRTFLS